ncbi:MAG: PTS transporter subunit EIIB [Fusobacteriaceae bacterium]
MESLARELVENLGGLSNISEIEDCITRIRVSVKSLDKVNMKNIKMLEEVLQIVITDTVQIVLGPRKSRKITKIIRSFEKVETPYEVQDKKQKKVLIQRECEDPQRRGTLKSFVEKILNR